MTKYLWILFLICTTAFAAPGKLQDSSFMTLAQITAAGGTAAQLLNATRVYDTVNSQQLSTTLTGLNTSIAGKLSSTLTSAHIFVGNGSAVATDVALSGDATLSNTGVLTLANTAVTAGSYTNLNATIDSKGRIITASNGSSGSGTVTSVSVASANGFAGTSSGGATPALTLSTTITGIAKGNGTGFSAATAGTDYQVPITAGDLTTSGATATLANTAVTAGSYTNLNATIDSKGRITLASNGSGGGGGGGNTVGEITIGGLTFTTTNMFVLRAVNGSSGSTHFMNATPGNTGHAVYHVTAGKTFVLYAYCFEIISTSSNSVGDPLLYADNDIGVESATTPTNPKGVFSGVTSGNDTDIMTGSFTNGEDGINAANGNPRCLAAGGSVPAGKYPYVNLQNSRGITTLYGYEI